MQTSGQDNFSFIDRPSKGMIEGARPDQSGGKNYEYRKLALPTQQLIFFG